MHKQKDMSDYFENQVKRSFFDAVRADDFESVENYISRFDIEVDLTDELGNTALNLASQLCLYDMVEKLILIGADQHRKNYAGLSARDYSVGLSAKKKESKTNLSIDEILADAEDSEDGNDSEFEIGDI